MARDPNTATVELTALIGASRLDAPEGKAGLAAAVAYGMRQSKGSTTTSMPWMRACRLRRTTSRPDSTYHY